MQVAMRWGRLIGWGIGVWVIAVAIDLPGIVGATLKATDPINTLITSVGHPCDPPACRTTLVPHVFKLGESRETVRVRLIDAGYKGQGDRYWREDNTRPNFLSSLACDVTYSIDLSFDADGRLTSAFGDPDVFCF